jgi:D-3-phosphoglycerate dehydrogenase
LVGTDYFPVDPPSELSEFWPADRLDDLLGISDVVLLTLPLNEHTEGMFDSKRLNQMRPGSLLINVARGAVVVEEALVDVLKSGQLGGAGLDVTEVEPLSPESLLWDDPKVMISPHVGAQSSRRVDDTTDFACVNLERYLRGELPYNRVDKVLGFPHPSVVWRPGTN